PARRKVSVISSLRRTAKRRPTRRVANLVAAEWSLRVLPEIPVWAITVAVPAGKRRARDELHGECNRQERCQGVKPFPHTPKPCQEVFVCGSHVRCSGHPIRTPRLLAIDLPTERFAIRV